MMSITGLVFSLLTILLPIICIILIVKYIYKNYQNTSKLIAQNEEIIALLKQNSKDKY